MKWQKGKIYLKKEVMANAANDCVELFDTAGKRLNCFMLYLDKDDELYLKDFYKTEYIDPITKATGGCYVLKFELPDEVYKKVLDKKLQKKVK